MSTETIEKAPVTDGAPDYQFAENYLMEGHLVVTIDGITGTGSGAIIDYTVGSWLDSTSLTKKRMTAEEFSEYIKDAENLGGIPRAQEFRPSLERGDKPTPTPADETEPISTPGAEPEVGVPLETHDKPADKESAADIERELGALDAHYRDLLKQYGEMSADNDTKSPLMRKMLGGKKRERVREALYDELAAAKSACAMKFVSFCAKMGVYEGEGTQVEQRMSDDVLDTIRELDSEIRAQTSEVLLRREGEHNLYQKAATHLGRFLNWGDTSLKRHAKNAGAGAVVGVVKGAALALFSGSFPVSVTVAGVVMTGVSATARYGSTLKYQEEALRSHVDDDGKVIPRLTNEQFEALRDSIKSEGTDDIEEMGNRLAREILSGAREAGLAENKAARRKASKNMAGLGIGMALGGIMGGFGSRAIHDAWVSARQHARIPGIVIEGTPEKPYVPSMTPMPPEHPPDVLPSAEIPKSPDLLANNFTVEHGSSFTQEWEQWASANGHPIEPDTAGALQQALLKKFGPQGIIDLDKVADASKEVYAQGGDIRISAAGSAHWRAGVAEYAQQWLQQQGNW